ncbi:MAG: sulfatase [Bacteroidales bacterium]|nr:sulfatase [Bacteroidales bacterium]
MNIDDMGWRDVGFMGSEYYETPNLDALAAEGMIFTQAYASAANCAPSRACMMSGQWTPRHGIYTVGSSKRGKSKNRKLIPTKNNTILGDENYILAEALKDAGYVTCHAGKWHLNDDPTTQGFDVNIGGTHAGHPSSYYPPYKNVPLEASEKNDYLTNLIMDKVLEFLDSVGSSPFFLNYSPYAVHSPIHPIRDLLPKYTNKAEWNGQNNAKYATMIENLDTQIGRMISYLMETDKLDNTLIIFISDNGGVYKFTKQWPLRAGKGAYYEGGIREPMFAYWKGKILAGSVCEDPISNLDFYPTLVDLTGINLPTDTKLDGNSLLPLFLGEKQTLNRPLFWHFPIYLEGGNKETQDPRFRSRPGSAIRYGDWKLIEYFENGDLELYNLTEDVGEKNNLAESNPEKLDELKKMLDEWRQSVGAPVPSEINPDWERD